MSVRRAGRPTLDKGWGVPPFVTLARQQPTGTKRAMVASLCGRPLGGAVKSPTGHAYQMFASTIGMSR